MIAEGLKSGNCSVTRVGLVSLGGLLVQFGLLTCADQRNIDGLSPAVQNAVDEICNRNEYESDQRRAEVTAILQVCFVFLPLAHGYRRVCLMFMAALFYNMNAFFIS